MSTGRPIRRSHRPQNDDIVRAIWCNRQGSGEQENL